MGRMIYDQSLGIKAVRLLLAPVVRWSIRFGIGHGHFSRLAKPLFYEAAENELLRRGLKCNDSSLSLTSGLHKGDIAALRQAQPDEQPIPSRIQPADQVIARWLVLGWPRQIPLRGHAGQSFDGLVKACHKDGASALSTRLILQDLIRRGMLREQDGDVHLLDEVGEQDADGLFRFVTAVCDHMETCLHNFESLGVPRLLEQSLEADGLHAPSVEHLHVLARQWWQKAVRSIGSEAIAHCERDEPIGGDHRLRLGVYFYSAPASPPSHSRD